MKPLHYLGSSLGFMLGIASADVEYDIPDNYTTVWAQNVNRDGGWYDVNKTSLEEGHRESLMCYAASASNLIAWWQNIYYESQMPGTTPPGVDDIWKKYLDNNLVPESGGNPLAAINWWISGVYAPLDGNKWASADDDRWNRFVATYEELGNAYDEKGNAAMTLLYPYVPGEEYFYDLHGMQQSDLNELLVSAWSYNSENPSLFDVDFAEIFESGGGVSLSLFSAGKTALAHSITLWGVTYDDKGQVDGLWITDSDDIGKKEEDLFYAEVYEDDGRLFFEDETLYGSDDAFVGAVFVLDSSWRVVPEPATATLSLLALAGMAARRRRAL